MDAISVDNTRAVFKSNSPVNLPSITIISTSVINGKKHKKISLDNPIKKNPNFCPKA